MAGMSQTRPDATRETDSSEPTSTNVSQEEANDNAGPARDMTTTQAPLPQHWEELKSSDGSTFYANHATRTTAWRRPAVEVGEDDAKTQAGLPAAWQELVDSDGKTYYANHESRTTTFDRPKSLTGELPAGWELLRTPQGVAYFADHNTHTVTWDDPRSACPW
jgi:hypothetical protein